MKPYRFAIFGAGFWARVQLAAWREVGGVECVAIYNRSRDKAVAFARDLGVPAVYDDAEKLVREVKPDFVDNITEIGGHKPLSLLCAKHRVPCICQKPMAASLADAREMVAAFARAKTPFFVHENWRWQSTMRALIETLRSGVIGTPFRARLSFLSGFDVWANQPALKKLQRFILSDLGVHLLDTARACFGEAGSLYCQLHKTLAPGVKGDNVATLLLAMGEAKTSVTVEVAYAKTPLERECFPQTLAFVEGPRGSVEVTEDYRLRVTTKKGTHSRRHAPPRYAWADARYDLSQSSMVACHRDLLAALRGEREAETTGADNLKTMELVFAAYDSARTNTVVTPGQKKKIHTLRTSSRHH
ncbi:MAG TPA: Gfo/Idh/MocA family oxidoreductase [Candidatus Angelobacter sp.]|nr:Gfo/Idh/MocA family oxidoreductase [Candidatus Angelobacter sp.]